LAGAKSFLNLPPWRQEDQQLNRQDAKTAKENKLEKGVRNPFPF
jgi:hypothetical protein